MEPAVVAFSKFCGRLGGVLFVDCRSPDKFSEVGISEAPAAFCSNWLLVVADTGLMVR